jgi:hypothetical protein
MGSQYVLYDTAIAAFLVYRLRVNDIGITLSSSKEQENLAVLDYTLRLTDKGKKKVKLSLCRPWRHLGLREVEAPTVLDIRLIDGGKVVSLTHRPLITPRKILSTHFC